MVQQLALFRHQDLLAPSSPCEHRAVSRDGRVICSKIAHGDNSLSPAICHSCPARAVNCSHLRFSLRLTSPSAVVVRCNGRTQVWDDESPSLSFQHAACAERIAPVHHPRACAGCTLRAPVRLPGLSAGGQCPAGRTGKVVPFPLGEPAAASA